MEDDEHPQPGVEGECTRSGSLGQAHRGAEIVIPLSTAPPAISTLVASVSSEQPQAPILPTVTSTPLTAVYPLYRVPEDQTGAAKEAMIQAEQMMRRTKEAYEVS